MSEQRTTWQKRLEPFGHIYAAMVREIEAQVDAMTDDELQKVLAATKRPTPTNIWWATYNVAPLVTDAVEGERRHRASEAKAARALRVESEVSA